MGLSQPLKTRTLQWLLFAVLALCAGWASGNPPTPESNPSAQRLRAKYTELGSQLLDNQFQRPLYLSSAESSRDLKGDIYAVVDYPFATVNAALNNPAHWCDVLILHINVKYCHASSSKTGTTLTINLGRNFDQPLADSYRNEFGYSAVITSPDYFAVELSAETGPLGTHDYHIGLEAVSLKNGRTFLHFTYAYAFGVTGNLAMQGYLATLGRDKVGFTVMGRLPNGQPDYIHGVRGVVERNTMRYFLAIDAYLATVSVAPEDQLELRLQKWYDSTELFARQLHEVERVDYLEMKHREYLRQQ
jgi:hypothetical protein